MGASNVVFHSGFLSSLPVDKIGDGDYDPYYVLQDANETITFTNSDGDQMYLNSLLIEAETTDLKINIEDYVLYIPAETSKNIDHKKLGSIQVMNATGIKIRWSGLYY